MRGALTHLPPDHPAALRAGHLTGSLLVFIPMMGEYLIPGDARRGRVFLIGNVLYLDFLDARNWPLGSAMAVVLILAMLLAVGAYLWFTSRGRTQREVSML